jgi:uncharacterized protein YbjT (DUF2867 family)
LTAKRRVLLTGATGFVGVRLYPHLREAGFEVLCASRNVSRARRFLPGRNWVELNVCDEPSADRALSGQDLAVYLIHAMDEGPGYGQRELEGARCFVRAAEKAGLERIVFLGGVHPRGHSSDHLRSRNQTGEALRSGSVPTWELCASMIVGRDSLSWEMCQRAARLRILPRPPWLKNAMAPVALNDVLQGLVASLTHDLAGHQLFSLPGRDVWPAWRFVDEAARLMGRKVRWMDVPDFDIGRLSKPLRLFFPKKHHILRELVKGMRDDLLGAEPPLWPVLGKSPLPFAQAAQNALVAAQIA